jgi:hypothetical protein
MNCYLPGIPTFHPFFHFETGTLHVLKVILFRKAHKTKTTHVSTTERHATLFVFHNQRLLVLMKKDTHPSHVSLLPQICRKNSNVDALLTRCFLL